MAGVVEAALGKPRRLVEAAFVVRDQVTGEQVTFRYTDRQRDLYPQTWGSVEGWGEGFNLLLVKSRQEQATTQTDAELMALCMSRPDVRALVVADSDETNATSLENWDIWYNNIPEEVPCLIDGKPGVIGKTRKGQPWNTEQRVFSFGEIDSAGNYVETGISSVAFASVRSVRTGIGKAFDVVLFHEVGKAPADMAKRVMTNILNGLPRRAKVIYEGTPDPEQGRESYAYHLMQEWRRDPTLGKVLVRYWFLNPVNIMAPGDMRASPELREGFALSTEMEAVMQHPAWPVGLERHQVEAKFRWRDRKIRENLGNTGGRWEAALAVFKQEFPENDVDMWAGKVASGIDQEAQQFQLSILARPYAPSRAIVPGFDQTIFTPPAFGHVYTGVLDPAKDVAGGDSTSFQVMDNTTRTHVAEIHGKARLEIAVDACLKLLGTYHQGMFVAETNGLGAAVPEIAMRLGYPVGKIFVRRHIREKFASRGLGVPIQERGFTTGDKQVLAQALLEAIHTRGFATPSKDAWDAISLYDWNLLRDHTPDRAICFAIWAYLVAQGELPMGVRSESQVIVESARERPVVLSSTSGILGVPSRF